jgi:hypothetical protein
MLVLLSLALAFPHLSSSLSIRGKFQQLWDGYPDFHAASCPAAMEAVAPNSIFCNDDVKGVKLSEGEFFRLLDGCPPSVSGKDVGDYDAEKYWMYYDDEKMEEKCVFKGDWTRIGSSCATRVSVALAHANVPLPRNGNPSAYNTGDRTWWTPNLPTSSHESLNNGWLMVNAAALREAQISDLFTDPKTIWEYDGEWFIELGRRKPKTFINEMPEVRKMFNNKAGLICWEYQWIEDNAYKGTGHCDIYNGYIRQSAGHDDAWGARRVHSVTLVEDVDYRPDPPAELSYIDESSCRTTVYAASPCSYPSTDFSPETSEITSDAFTMAPHASSYSPYGCAESAEADGPDAFAVQFCHSSPVPEWRFKLSLNGLAAFKPPADANVLEFTVTNTKAAGSIVPTELRVAADVDCGGGSTLAVSTARTYPAPGESITYRIPLDGADWMLSTNFYAAPGLLMVDNQRLALRNLQFLLTAPDAGDWKTTTPQQLSTATISNIRFVKRSPCAPVYKADSSDRLWRNQYFSYCSNNAGLSHYEGSCVAQADIDAAGTNGAKATFSSMCLNSEKCVVNDLSPCNEIIKDPHLGEAESCAGLIPLGNGGEELCHAAPVKVRSAPCGAVVYMMPPPAITGVKLPLIRTNAIERCGQLWYPVTIPSSRQVYTDPHTGMAMSSDVPEDEPSAEELDDMTGNTGIGYVLASQVHRCDGYLPAPSSFDEGEEDEIPCIACMDPATGAMSTNPDVCSMQPGVCTTIDLCDDPDKFLSSKVIDGVQIVGGCQNLPGPVRCCLAPTEASVSCPWCRADSGIAEDGEGSDTLVIILATVGALCVCAVCIAFCLVGAMMMRRRRTAPAAKAMSLGAAGHANGNMRRSRAPSLSAQRTSRRASQSRMSRV